MKSFITTVLLAAVSQALPAPHVPKKNLARAKRVAELHDGKNTLYNYFAQKMECDVLEYKAVREDNEMRQKICLMARDTHDYF